MTFQLLGEAQCWSDWKCDRMVTDPSKWKRKLLLHPAPSSCKFSSLCTTVPICPSAHENHRESRPAIHGPVLTFQSVVNWFWVRASYIPSVYLLLIKVCFREPKTCATPLVNPGKHFLVVLPGAGSDVTSSPEAPASPGTCLLLARLQRVASTKPWKHPKAPWKLPITFFHFLRF